MQAIGDTSYVASLGLVPVRTVVFDVHVKAQVGNEAIALRLQRAFALRRP